MKQSPVSLSIILSPLPASLVPDGADEEGIGVDVLVLLHNAGQRLGADPVPVQVSIAQDDHEVLVRLFLRDVHDGGLGGFHRVVAAQAELSVGMQVL